MSNQLEVTTAHDDEPITFRNRANPEMVSEGYGTVDGGPLQMHFDAIQFDDPLVESGRVPVTLWDGGTVVTSCIVDARTAAELQRFYRGGGAEVEA